MPQIKNPEMILHGTSGAVLQAGRDLLHEIAQEGDASSERRERFGRALQASPLREIPPPTDIQGGLPCR